jgi:cytochrome c-type biogenesis protein CcmH/NrfF
MKANLSKKRTPAFVSPTLEADMKKYLEQKLRKGMKRRTVVRMMHRKFGDRIAGEVHTGAAGVRKYKWWARPIVRLIRWIRSRNSKST